MAADESGRPGDEVAHLVSSNRSTRTLVFPVVSFRVPADPGDPGVPEVRLGRAAGADGALERRIVRDGAPVLAHGALVCPGCGIPVAAHGAVPIAAYVRCGF